MPLPKIFADKPAAPKLDPVLQKLSAEYNRAMDEDKPLNSNEATRALHNLLTYADTHGDKDSRINRAELKDLATAAKGKIQDVLKTYGAHLPTNGVKINAFVAEVKRDKYDPMELKDAAREAFSLSKTWPKGANHMVK